MNDWLAGQLENIRSHLTSVDEGALWLLLYEDPHGDAVMAAAIDDAMEQVGHELIQGIAKVLDEVPAKAVLLAVVRSSGQPAAVDRFLWRQLRLNGPSVHLIDLVVVGDTAAYSVRLGGDA